MADTRPRKIKYLAAMAGEAVDLPAPVTRRDHFFAKAAGMDVQTPPPITREEKYLSQIQPGGGGSLDPLDNPASPAEILDGYEAYSDQGAKIVGTLDTSLPALSAPASAADIAYGAEAYNDQKQKIVGSMPDGNGVYY